MDVQPQVQGDTQFTDRLPDEIEKWKAEGLIRSEQAEALLARYGLTSGETPQTVHLSRFVLVLAVFGAVLVGTGVILFVGSNWEIIPRWLRLLLIIAAIGAAYGAGYAFTFSRRSSLGFSMAFMLLGSLFWGAGLFLVGQMFHSSGGPGGGERLLVFFWFVGVLPLAYVLRSSWHMALSIIIGITWFSMMLYDGFSDPFEWYLLSVLCLGIALFALANIHGHYPYTRPLIAPLRWFGLAFIATSLYAFTFGFLPLSSGTGKASSGYVATSAVVFFLCLIAVIWMMTACRTQGRVILWEGVSLLFLLACCLAIALVISGHLNLRALEGDIYRDHSYTAKAFFNLLLLAGIVALIADGWARNLPGYANFGIAIFFLLLMTRYFDLLGNLLTGGIVFIGAGVILILGGFLLEQTRRRLVLAIVQRGSV